MFFFKLLQCNCYLIVWRSHIGCRSLPSDENHDRCDDRRQKDESAENSQSDDSTFKEKVMNRKKNVFFEISLPKLSWACLVSLWLTSDVGTLASGWGLDWTLAESGISLSMGCLITLSWETMNINKDCQKLKKVQDLLLFPTALHSADKSLPPNPGSEVGP